MNEQTQPTDAELIAFATEEQFLLFCDQDEFTDIARAVLAKWGTPAGAGEPVSHQYQSKDGTWHEFIDQRHYNRTVASGGWPIRALYTTPQPTQAQAGAVPLTDEQIDALDLPPSGTATVRDLVRIIEAAHGIGIKGGRP